MTREADKGSPGFRDDDASRFRLRVHYADAEHAAAVEGERQGYPCAEGCAWCCRSVVMVTNGDVAVMREGVRAMPAEKRAELAAKAAAFAAMFGPYAKRGIRDAPFHAPLALAHHWPDGGIACPALEETEPGRGRCTIYRHRPLVCRLHHARGVEDGTAAGCRPGGKETPKVEVLDAGPLHQRIVSEHGLSLVGLLGLELAELLEVERA